MKSSDDERSKSPVKKPEMPAESVPKSPAAPTARELTPEEKEDRVRSAVKEWTNIYDKNEVMLSLREIGVDLYPKFISTLIISSSELKKPDLEKAVSLIKTLLLSNDFTTDQVKEGCVLVNLE